MYLSMDFFTEFAVFIFSNPYSSAFPIYNFFPHHLCTDLPFYKFLQPPKLNAYLIYFYSLLLLNESFLKYFLTGK